MKFLNDKFSLGGYMFIKVKDFIIGLISVISGILTIISFIWMVLDINITKVNITIDLKTAFDNISIIVFSVFFIMFIFCILLLRKEKLKNREKQKVILSEFNGILAMVQSWLIMSFKERKYSSCIGPMQYILKRMKLLFNSVFDKEVRIQVRVVSLDKDDYLYTHIMCDTKLIQNDIGRIKYKVENDVGFSTLINDKEKRYFSLSLKDKKRLETYKNPSGNIMQDYSSCLIVPIFTTKKDDTSNIMGFVSLYSLEANAFNLKFNELVVPLLEIIAGYLHIMLELEMNTIIKDNKCE